ncbi:MAG: FxLYD domain-containing protein [Halolamina sp.]|uniref:FxLYD domain-containing protein n=1 Tax=Halolamina sp. TaxID=1940283 RepID=UPI002FC39438
MRRRALLSAARIAVTGSLVALAGCSDQPDDGTERSPTDESPTSSPTPSPTPTPSTIHTPEGGSLRVAEHALERRNEDTENELAVVTGTVENTGETAAEDVQATARFLDDSSAVLGKATARNTELGAGSRWELELVYDESGADAQAVVDYRLVVEQS